MAAFLDNGMHNPAVAEGARRGFRYPRLNV